MFCTDSECTLSMKVWKWGSQRAVNCELCQDLETFSQWKKISHQGDCSVFAKSSSLARAWVRNGRLWCQTQPWIARVQTRSLASRMRLFPPSPIVTTSRSLKNQPPPHNSLQWCDLPSLPSSHSFFCPATGHSYTSCWPVGLWKAKNTNKYKYK